MPLPTLQNAEPTIRSLHKAAQMLIAFRRMLTEPHPNNLHLTLRPTEKGLSSGRLSNNTEVTLEFGSKAFVLNSGERILLDGANDQPIFDRLLSSGAPDAQERWQSARAWLATQDATAPTETTLSIDAPRAADYAQAQFAVFDGLARFRARLHGLMTPIGVFPHGFDISFLWFAGLEADERNAPHLNFGFAPYSRGIDYAYLYAYAYPLVANASPSLPAPARWHTEGWNGIVLPYDSIAAQNDASAYVEAMAEAFYEVLLTVLKR